MKSTRRESKLPLRRWISIWILAHLQRIIISVNCVCVPFEKNGQFFNRFGFDNSTPQLIRNIRDSWNVFSWFQFRMAIEVARVPMNPHSLLLHLRILVTIDGIKQPLKMKQRRCFLLSIITVDCARDILNRYVESIVNVKISIEVSLQASECSMWDYLRNRCCRA